jgi:hypothetical protein
MDPVMRELRPCRPPAALRRFDADTWLRAAAAEDLAPGAGIGTVAGGTRHG